VPVLNPLSEIPFELPKIIPELFIVCDALRSLVIYATPTPLLLTSLKEISATALPSFPIIVPKLFKVSILSKRL
jgi:hypothetical protein